MRYLLYLVVAIFCSLSVPATLLAEIGTLNKGIGVNRENINSIARTSYEYARARGSHKDNGESRVLAFFREDGSQKLFSLSPEPAIYLTDFESKDLISYWPLTRWSHIERPPEILKALRNWGQGYDRWLEKVSYTSHAPGVGCLNKAPLRYGDIEGDGEPELVLFLNGELIVFSPKYERTVFATLIDASDWLREDWETGKAEDGKIYQFVSAMGAVNGITGKAFRAYAKVYFGDFDEDENWDFLTWEKVYESNKVGEPAGFKLIAERFRHFERDLEAQTDSEKGVTGEYLPQETSGETVQAWLADNELTWSDGYPNDSECDGEENELIPELHDPLLNDPDVLN